MEIIRSTAESFLENYIYAPDNTEFNGVNSILLARKIRDKLRESNRIPRYKINVQVFIGEKKDQKVIITAKGCWDHYLDNYAPYTYHGDGFYCTVLVWGFYID